MSPGFLHKLANAQCRQASRLGPAYGAVCTEHHSTLVTALGEEPGGRSALSIMQEGEGSPSDPRSKGSREGEEPSGWGRGKHGRYRRGQGLHRVLEVGGWLVCVCEGRPSRGG